MEPPKPPPMCDPRSGNPDDVCISQSIAWRECVEGQYKDKKLSLDEHCRFVEEAFHSCVADWRAIPGNAEVRVKGAKKGLPPVQCSAMSCVYEQCLAETGFDFSKCKAPMAHFKRCVKAMYLSEYVD